MSIWFFIVLVIGILYALNRRTTTTDVAVSARLARLRALIEARWARRRPRHRVASGSSCGSGVVRQEAQEDHPADNDVPARDAA